MRFHDWMKDLLLEGRKVREGWPENQLQRYYGKDSGVFWHGYYRRGLAPASAVQADKDRWTTWA
jgi:hypothetical protein